MAFAYHLDQGTMLEAAAIRDQIRDDLRAARLGTLEGFSETIADTIGGIGKCLLVILMSIPALAVLGGIVWVFLRMIAAI